jgi:hypothetical protein
LALYVYKARKRILPGNMRDMLLKEGDGFPVQAKKFATGLIDR